MTLMLHAVAVLANYRQTYVRMYGIYIARMLMGLCLQSKFHVQEYIQEEEYERVDGFPK